MFFVNKEILSKTNISLSLQFYARPSRSHAATRTGSKGTGRSSWWTRATATSTGAKSCTTTAKK